MAEMMIKSELIPATPAKGTIKCVVWDLDDTLWQGILLEDEQVHLSENTIAIIKTLDSRGILQSIASKNDPIRALAMLQKYGIQDYFLYPQIHWSSKVTSIEKIAQSLNIGMDAIAFIDDQPFELDEVQFSLPQVHCIPAADLDRLLEMPALCPRFMTEDSQRRRLMYLNDIERSQAETEFVGPKEAFLASLNLKFTITEAKEDDLQRAEELTVRTHQLNATGYTYSYTELNQFRQSEHYKLFIASLEDKYGSYGKIGLALVECQDSSWTVKLLLMSCRVMSRGVGSVMLNHIIKLAKQKHRDLYAEFVPTDRNRMMYITYKFAGFQEIERSDRFVLLKHNLEQAQPCPDYITLQTDE